MAKSNITPPHFSKETERSMFLFFLKHFAPLIYEDQLAKSKLVTALKNVVIKKD